MFQGLRQGALLYILDKQKTAVETAQVISISNPAPRYNTAQPFNLEQVVDITANTTAGVVDYKQLPATASVANFGSLVVSDSRDAMTAEVEALCQAAKAHIDATPYHQAVLDKREEMLSAINPQLAKDRARDEEIDSLRKQLARIESLLSNPGTKAETK